MLFHGHEKRDLQQSLPILTYLQVQGIPLPGVPPLFWGGVEVQPTLQHQKEHYTKTTPSKLQLQFPLKAQFKVSVKALFRPRKAISGLRFIYATFSSWCYNENLHSKSEVLFRFILLIQHWGVVGEQRSPRMDKVKSPVNAETNQPKIPTLHDLLLYEDQNAFATHSTAFQDLSFLLPQKLLFMLF